MALEVTKFQSCHFTNMEVQLMDRALPEREAGRGALGESSLLLRRRSTDEQDSTTEEESCSRCRF